ncbi:hypothetical protein Tco_0815931 [Tanacetum coccineum]
MDSFQGLTSKSPSSSHRYLAPTLYDHESWNDLKDLAKPVKAISLPQDVPSTSDCYLIELENQVQCLMEAHLAPKPSVQVNKVASSCKICGGPHDTQICMENPKQAFVDYTSLRTDKAGGALSSNTVKNPKLNCNPTSSVSSARSYQIEDPQSSSHPFNSVNAIKTCFNSTNDFQKDKLQVKTLTINKTETPKLKELERDLKNEFKDLHLKLLVFEVLAHAPRKWIIQVLLWKNMFETEKALRNGEVYNWKNAKYGKINWCLEDVDADVLRFFEIKFSAIVYNDTLKLKSDLSSEPSLNYDINLKSETSLLECNFEKCNFKAERKSLKKRFSKKEKFDILNIGENLFSYDTPANNLQFYKGNDNDKLDIRELSMNSSVELLRATNNTNMNTYVDMSNKLREICYETINRCPSNYVPNDEWKRLELKKNNSKQANQECIGEYEPMIDDNDFEYMCDYLLSKDAPFAMDDEKERLEEKKYKPLGTPHEQISSIEQEFDI